MAQVRVTTSPPFLSATSTYKESDIFYSKDLSQFLKSIGTKIEVKEDNDNNTTLEVAGGIWKIPFEFAIPDDALYYLMNRWYKVSQMLSIILFAISTNSPVKCIGVTV